MQLTATLILISCLSLHVSLSDESALRAMIDDFECLSTKTLYYSDAPDVEIPDLPQVRLMMCGYESQCALQFAAFLFMREQLGINVTFYPTLDYDDIWNDEHWGSAPLAYPRKYFEWLADDEGDLQFEIWPEQMMRTNGTGHEVFNGQTEFILEDRVDFGGFVGAYGEEAVWVPSYVLESEPDFYIPASLREKAEYREQLIHAATGKYEGVAADATDFVTLYTPEFDAPDFDAPTYDLPTVWTSQAYYFGSEYVRDLISTPPNNLDMNFVATGSETGLAALVTELYAARQPLLAYLYTLDVNFGRVDAATGELQQFAKLAYPRNPGQSATDPCFEERKCQFPVAPIMKIANPLLRERFPEAYDFFTLFQMTTSQINLLVSKYLAIQDDTSGAYDDMSSTEKWLHATCEWMRSDRSASTSSAAWDVSIERYSCPGGCGFIADDGSQAGGSCNEFTGLCDCDHPGLFQADSCRASCPGLLWQPDGSGSFMFCSGHGTCDTTSKKCVCDDEWTGDDCSSEITTVRLTEELYHRGAGELKHLIIEEHLVYAVIGVLVLVVCLLLVVVFKVKKCCGKRRAQYEAVQQIAAPGDSEAEEILQVAD